MMTAVTKFLGGVFMGATITTMILALVGRANEGTYLTLAVVGLLLVGSYVLKRFV